jgi:GT2 family glycosyltransferase
MNETLRFSVVIPTLNRPEAVEALVRQFLEQDYANFEVVIVDQSDEEHAALKALMQADPRVRYVHIDQAGTCHARNVGVGMATGEIIFFVDDDSELPQRDLLTLHAENYQDPNLGGVGGRVVDHNRKLNREVEGPTCWVTPDGRVYPNATGLERVTINAPRGGHMSFRKSIIEAVGGFDEQFVGNAMREETDFSLRVVEAGKPIIFEPRATVVHLGLHTGGSRQRDRRQWYEDFFANELYFFLKHFSRQYLPTFFHRKTRAILSCMFFYGLGRPAWIRTPWKGFRLARERYEHLRERR